MKKINLKNKESKYKKSEKYKLRKITKRDNKK